jgi:hypothetical protein
MCKEAANTLCSFDQAVYSTGLHGVISHKTIVTAVKISRISPLLFPFISVFLYMHIDLSLITLNYRTVLGVFVFSIEIYMHN